MRQELELQYRLRFEGILKPLAESLEVYIRETLAGVDRVDRVQARAKSPSRFMAKAGKGSHDNPKYSDPISQIQDQIGARIIVFYVSDVERVARTIDRYFNHIEKRDLVPESVSEFGYFGRHYLLNVPTDIIDPDWDKGLIPDFFELQIKTLFQHAWAEANHDLGYKELGGELSQESKRRMAWAAAQAWGADQIFNDLASDHSQQAGA
jgi:putative GTP pyrophosphokinase